MYCSISCSRAARSPSSWYRRSRSLSLSATGARASHSDLLREPDRVAVHVHVVDSRFEHTPQAQLVVLLTLDLVEEIERQRTDARLECAVAECHTNGDVSVLELTATEDRVECNLEVLEILDRQVHPDRKSAENEMGNAVEVGVARNGQRDLVNHREPSTLRQDPARGALPRPLPHRPLRASCGAYAVTPTRATRRLKDRRASAPASSPRS